MAMSRLGIIMVTYGKENQPYLDYALQSVFRSKGSVAQLIVVSSGDYASVVDFKDITRIHSMKRLHFPEAVALGYEQIDKDIDIICLLNDDIILQYETLQNMRFMVENNERMLINPLSNCDNGKTFIFDFGKYSHNQYQLNQIGARDFEAIVTRSNLYPKGVILTGFIAFYCTMMRRAHYDDIGGIDPTFKTGQDDLDFCLRARAKDYIMGIATDTFCFHFSGATADRVLTQSDRDFNMDYFKSKWGDQVRFDPTKANR